MADKEEESLRLTLGAVHHGVAATGTRLCTVTRCGEMRPIAYMGRSLVGNS